jgi:hypothetical protein
MARSRPPEEKRILCTACGGLLIVDHGAKSVSCRHCNARVICERLDVKDYVAVRKFRTANAMHIRKKGIVYASVFAEDLTIEGVLQGDATALYAIHLSRKARVTADLRASALSIEAGASLTGHVRIGPQHMPELKALAQPLPGEEMERMESRWQLPSGR